MSHINKAPILLEEGWAVMQTGITKLQDLLDGRTPDVQALFNSEEYMKLYTTIYNMCTQKSPHDYSEQLYARYQKTFESYLSDSVVPSLIEKEGEFRLKELVHRWENHKLMAKWLSRFFHYLSRYFIQRKSLPDLQPAATTCFKTLVYDMYVHDLNISKVIIALIDGEREGERVDHYVLKKATEIYVEIGMGNMECYEKDFEAPMLDDSVAYYSQKAATWIEQDSCPDYMIKAEESLKLEKERVANYLHATSETKLLDKVQDELLTKVSSQLLNKEHSGCRALLRDGKTEDLSRMYRLFSRILKNGLDPVARTFKEHVTEEGLALLKLAEDAASNKKAEKKDVVGQQEQDYIRKLIELHEKYLEYVNTCFGNNSLFHKSLKEAFEVFCNKTVAGNNTAELLASFTDAILKKNDENTIDDTLDKVVKLLAFISDKDMFAEFSRKKLARRLIFDSSSNSSTEEKERELLTKLKQQYGGQFTSKMEGMVTDIILAKESEKQYQKIDKFTVKVLTTGYWPSYKSHDLNLPVEMVKCVEVFQEQYHNRTKHRKLTWIYSLGSANVDGYFVGKKIELVVTTYQAALLFLFNSADKLSYKEIKEQLNLSDDDVTRSLHSLSCAKYKILTKEPNTRTISETDVFEFNSKFTDKMRKIKIPLPPLTDEKKKVEEDVGKDRRYAIDASLVRIMKSRKVLGYQQLVMECVEQLSKMFKPDIKIIKKRIEDLITRDYLERDTDNPNTFKYLA